MARRSAFGDILRDPLILTLLGTNAAINAAESYSKIKAEPDPNAARFVNAAMLQGSPVTSLPKEPGLFTSIGKLFGASPDIQAKPETLVQEQLAIQQKREADIAKLASFRNAFGPEATEDAIAHGMFGNAALGVFPSGKVPLKPSETKALAGPKELMITESPVTSEGYLDPTRPELRVPSSTKETKPNYIFGTARPKPERAPRETKEEAAAKAGAVKEATMAVEAKARDATDLADWTKGGMFYDVNTGQRPPKGKFTYGSHPNNYVQLSEKGKLTLDDRILFDARMDELQNSANKLLIDTSKMSPAAARAAIKANHLKIMYAAGDAPWHLGGPIGGFFVKPSADAVALESGGKLDAISMLTGIQHRYPNTKELVPGFEFLGNMGEKDLQTATELINKARLMGNTAIRRALSADAEAESPAVGDSVDTWKSGK